MGCNLMGDQDTASAQLIACYSSCVFHINNESNVQPTRGDSSGL